MTKDSLVLRALISSVLSASAVAAYAENAPEPGVLDEIVVTASGGDKTQLNSSVSVTSVSVDLIKNFQPSSEAEVFRMIPGIQVSGTSGPGGNSNIAVRGQIGVTGNTVYSTSSSSASRWEGRSSPSTPIGPPWMSSAPSPSGRCC